MVASNAWFFMMFFAKPLWLVWLAAIVVGHTLWIIEEEDAFGRLQRKPYFAAMLDALTIATSVQYFTHEPLCGVVKSC